MPIQEKESLGLKGQVPVDSIYAKEPCRVQANEMLSHRIHVLERKIQQLKTIRDMLPNNMSHHQDEAMFELFESMRIY